MKAMTIDLAITNPVAKYAIGTVHKKDVSEYRDTDKYPEPTYATVQITGDPETEQYTQLKNGDWQLGIPSKLSSIKMIEYRHYYPAVYLDTWKGQTTVLSFTVFVCQ